MPPKFIAWVPQCWVGATIIATIVPSTGREAELGKLPMLIVIAFVLMGEVVRIVSARKRTQSYAGIQHGLEAGGYEANLAPELDELQQEGA